MLSAFVYGRSQQVEPAASWRSGRVAQDNSAIVAATLGRSAALDRDLEVVILVLDRQIVR
jgi:hypothetical protein